MPELPEVETIRRQLAPQLVGSVLTDAWAFPSAKFTDAKMATGVRVTEIERRGKYLLIGLTSLIGLNRAAPQGLQSPDPTSSAASDDGVGPDSRQLVVHLGMTGRLGIHERGIGKSDRSKPFDQHLRAQWGLEDGRTLWFVDVRRFGRLAVVQRGDYRSLRTLNELGPEPWDPAFTGESLRTFTNQRRRAIKTLLLSQRPVAGVGNIYADEALWRAGIRPSARRLTKAGAQRLCTAIQEVLEEGIANGGTTLRDYRDAEGGTGDHQHHLDCYGRSGQMCNRCGTVMRRVVIDARSTTFCPVCQPN